MGTMTRRLLRLLPGWVAALGAGLVGTELAFVAIAMILYALASPLTGLPRAALLLAAPLVLATGQPLPTLLAVSALVWLVIALLSVAPLYLFLGGRVPLFAPGAWVLLTAALLTPLLWVDFAPSYFTSDIATRAQLLFLAAACILLSGLFTLVRPPTRAAQATEQTYAPLLGGDERTQTHLDRR